MSTPNLSNTSKSYLFKLSIPIFFSNIAIPFGGLVDTGLMGHLTVKDILLQLVLPLQLSHWFFGALVFLEWAQLV